MNARTISNALSRAIDHESREDDHPGRWARQLYRLNERPVSGHVRVGDYRFRWFFEMDDNDEPVWTLRRAGSAGYFSAASEWMLCSLGRGETFSTLKGLVRWLRDFAACP